MVKGGSEKGKIVGDRNLDPMKGDGTRPKSQSTIEIFSSSAQTGEDRSGSWNSNLEVVMGNALESET